MKYVIIFAITSIAGTAGVINQFNYSYQNKSEIPIQYIEFKNPMKINVKN